MTVVNVAGLGASGGRGKVHTMAYQTFPHFMGTDGGTACVAALVEANPAAAKDLAFRAPGAKIFTRWEDAVNDPDIDLIDICLPDNLHYEVAKAALMTGKHVYCEKPLADTASQARELADIAREKGVITRVGHAFPRNPIHDRAKEIIDAGDIGEIKLFKACQHIDIYGDPLAPYMWRADGDLAPTGIIGDTGSHVFSFMEFLVGRVSSLIADSYIATPKRPVVEGLGMATTHPRSPKTPNGATSQTPMEPTSCAPLKTGPKVSSISAASRQDASSCRPMRYMAPRAALRTPSTK